MRITAEVEVVDILDELTTSELLDELKRRKTELADEDIIDYLRCAGISEKLIESIQAEFKRFIPTRATLLLWESLSLPA